MATSTLSSPTTRYGFNYYNTGCTYANAGFTLTKTGLWSATQIQPGSRCEIMSGTGATVGDYTVSSSTADVLTLTSSIGAGADGQTNIVANVYALGQYLEFSSSAGTWAGTITVDATKIRVSITRDGFDNTGAATTRVCTPTAVKAVYSATGTKLRVYFSEPFHATDTAGTVECDAGAITDGTDTTAALASTAITVSSTAPDTKAVCNIISKVFDKITGPFYVDVYACAGAYEGYEANLGIACVKVTVTDNAGAGTAITKTATSMSSIDRIGSYGWQSQHHNVWRVGPFDPDPNGDWGAGGATDSKWATVTATAYPKIGDSRTTQTEYLFMDPDNNYGTKYAYVDPTGTITLSSGLTDPVIKGHRFVGGTSGGIGVVNQAYARGATSLSVSWVASAVAETTDFTSNEDLWFDTTKLPVDAITVASYITDETVIQNTSLASGKILAVSDKTAGAGAHTLRLYDVVGTFDTTNDVIGQTSGATSNPTATTSNESATTGIKGTMSGRPTWVAADGAGTPTGTQGVVNTTTAFRTINAAAYACRNGSNICSWSTVYLAAGRNFIGKYNGANNVRTDDGPIIITRAPGVALADAVIAGSWQAGSSDGIRTALIKFYDVQLDFKVPSGAGVQACYRLETGSPSGHTTPWTNTQTYLIFEQIVIDGPGVTRKLVTATNYFVEQAFTAMYVYGGLYGNCNNALAYRCRVFRDVTVDTCGSDVTRAEKTDVGQQYSGNCDLSYDSSGLGIHCDVYQLVGSTSSQFIYENCGFHQNIARNFQSSQTGPFYNGNIVYGDQAISIAFTNSLQENDVTSQSAQLDDCALFSWFHYHNFSDDKLLMRNRYSETNTFWLGNCINEWSINSTEKFSWTGKRNNHDMNGTFGTAACGIDVTTGQSTSTLFVDYANEGYTPDASPGTLIDRVADSPLVKDAYGRFISTDAAALASVGPLQPIPTLTVTYDGDSMSDGGTVNESAGTKSLVMSASTGITGSVVYISDVALGGTVTGTDASPYTLTAGGTTQSATISTTLTSGAGTVDITYDYNNAVFDFDITGLSAGGGLRARSRNRKR